MMSLRTVFFYIFFFFIIAPTFCLAQSPAEDEDPFLSESHNIYYKCIAPSGFSETYNCRCVMTEFYLLRHSSHSASQSSEVLAEALKKCPDTARIADIKYKQCIEWAARQRRDSDIYCKCYGGAYAQQFQKTPLDNQAAQTRMMSAAMSACNKALPRPR